MSLCGGISADNLSNCDNPLQAGTEDEMLVINREDIASITVNSTDNVTVEDITLKTGTKAFIIDGKRNSIAPSFAMVQTGVFKMFDHIVNAKGFDISADAKAEMNNVKEGRYVILTNNFYSGTDGNSKFEIYGITTGLEVTALTRNPNDDTQGAFDITFGTDLNKEPKVPAALFITDEATTNAVWESLKVPAT